MALDLKTFDVIAGQPSLATEVRQAATEDEARNTDFRSTSTDYHESIGLEEVVDRSPPQSRADRDGVILKL